MPLRISSAKPDARPSTSASSVRARPFPPFTAISAIAKPVPPLSLPTGPSKFPAITFSCPRASVEICVTFRGRSFRLTGYGQQRFPRLQFSCLQAKYLPRSGGTMNRAAAVASILLVGISLVPVGNHVIADEPPLFGYSAESSRAERQWEEKLRAIPSPENLRSYMQKLSARPHHVGSQADKDNAEWIASKFKEFGLDTHIEQFDVLFPTPKERVVELVEGGPKFVAKLQEPAVPLDPTSSQQAEQLPTYNAYSIDGDVTAPLVYVNYGVPEDYEQLDRMGVSVQGAIVIARYGGSWRGIKPKVAAEHGAVGCLIYSDPHEDGFVRGETFPAGA